MICPWCRKREVEIEILIYTLRREEETVSNNRLKGNKVIQILRDKKLMSIRICTQCSPLTVTNNEDRFRLRGHEIKQPQKT